MKKIHLTILTVALLAASLTGCNKYDEGPSLSFRSASSRVVNNWEPKVILEDGQDITYYFQNYSIELTEDGRFVSSDLDSQDSTFTQAGFWSLENDNQDLQFIYTEPAVNPDRRTFQIKKLKKDEIWLLEEQDSVTMDVRWIAVGSDESE